MCFVLNKFEKEILEIQFSNTHTNIISIMIIVEKKNLKLYFVHLQHQE